MKVFWRLSPCVAAVALLCGCEPAATSTVASKPMPPVAVQLVHPHRGEISRYVTLPGDLRANQQVTLNAKIAGYLKTISVDRGDAVKQDQVLAEIEAPELLADLAKAKAEVEVAAVDYKRVKEAQQKAPDLVMPQTVDEAKGRHDVALANQQRLETLLGYSKIIAPFSGIITKRWVDPGALIPAATSSAGQGSAVVTLMDLDTIRLDVAVPEPEVPLMTKDLPVKVTIDELPGENITAGLTRLAYALDDTSKTMIAEIDLRNPDHKLRPGMFATVAIAAQTKNDALIVPNAALLNEKGKYSVFAVEDGKAKKLPVKIGFDDGKSTEIVEGINADQPVILLGKLTLADKQPVTVTESK